jgi:hypothetical protein
LVSRTLVFLAELHLHVGLIGIDEFTERCKVAHWLDDNNASHDPREPAAAEGKDGIRLEDETNISGNVGVTPHASKNGCAGDELEFIWSGWVFTRQDEDPYPSTPHGHLRNPNRTWPKLNPYVGRVFARKHQENVKLRLTKKQMIALWSDQRFRDFCRSHVLWYTERFPQHTFSVTHHLRFPKPWR